MKKIISFLINVTQSSLYIKFTRSSVAKGLKKGLSIPTLPQKIAKFYNKIPNWFRRVARILKLIIIIIFLLNLLGFNNSIELLKNIYYIKLYGYITCSLMIIYQILNIYLLHKTRTRINNNIKISPVLPDFIIKWLIEIKSISSNEDSSKYFKNSSYIQILIYLLIILLLSIIL